ncbi:MAG: M17 family metallopeptidase [Patescibacteria group bacterium]|nr:M17 family metallopeptidase [Patescibacteria group bacterium]
MSTRAPEAPPAPTPPPIEFEFQTYDAMEFTPGHPVIFFAFEEQPDTVISTRFPEVEEMRLGIEKNREIVDDMTHLFPLARGEARFPAILVYIGRRWRAEKSRKTHFRFGSIYFYRTLSAQMYKAVKKLRDMGHTEFTIVLPGRFHPKHLKKDPRGEREEETFVQTLTESIVTANSPDTHQASPRPRIANVCFTHFGEHQQTATHFFRRTVEAGVEIGTAVSEARGLTKLPPSEKTPLLLVERMLGAKLALRAPSKGSAWRTVKRHQYGPGVQVQIISGVETLRRAGFGLIAAVGQGSRDEPCVLKIHYRPKNKPEGMKKVSLIGKGVILDTGGLNLKTDQTMDRMHYDMAGAATVAGVFRLAVETNLAVEIVTLLPIVENAIGPNAVRLNDVITAYDGQTVEITNTDAEGRLILADALAYSEKHVRPDAVVTVATLCDMADFGPDFIKVMTNDYRLLRKMRVAESHSHEKMLHFPPLDHFDNVSDLFTGTESDLVNDCGYHYHAGMIFLSRFLQWDPSTPWLYLDVAAVFETDADNYGAGPGFGVRYLWRFVEQFAR